MMTKSKKTLFKLLICVLAIFALATVLVACNSGYKPDDYDYLVTFEYNKGNLSGDLETQQIGVFANSLVGIRPGYSMDIVEGVVNGYYIEGWYLPKEFDENGNPVKDENGFVLLGRKWDFKTDRVNEDITLYGNFKKKSAIRFINMETGQYIDEINSTGRIERAPGETIVSPSAPNLSGYTCLGKYYTSIDGSEEFKWPVKIGETDIDIYVSFIKGEWSFVKDESGFITQIQANKNIYLENDLDFKDYNDYSLWGLSEYTGEINGNGHKISNVTRKIVANRNNTENFGGIFGGLGATAHIYDITFENVNVAFSVNSSYISAGLTSAYAGLLAGTAKEGAKLENVAISGKFSYKPSTSCSINDVMGSDTVIANAVIGDNKIKPDDIIGCDFDSVEIEII